MRGGGFWWRGTVVAAILAFAMSVAAETGARAEFYDGMELVARPPDPGVAYDTPILDPGAGIGNLVAALDALYRDSPASVAAITSSSRSTRSTSAWRSPAARSSPAPSPAGPTRCSA